MDLILFHLLQNLSYYTLPFLPTSAMAFSASLSFTPASLARPNNPTRNPRKNTPRKLSKNPKPNPNHRLEHRSTSTNYPLSSVPGGEATTYTRLPPRDDSFSSPFDSPSAEVKFSDLTITSFQNRKPAINKLDSEDDEFGSQDEVTEGKIFCTTVTIMIC